MYTLPRAIMILVHLQRQHPAWSPAKYIDDSFTWTIAAAHFKESELVVKLLNSATKDTYYQLNH